MINAAFECVYDGLCFCFFPASGADEDNYVKLGDDTPIA